MRYTVARSTWGASRCARAPTLTGPRASCVNTCSRGFVALYREALSVDLSFVAVASIACSVAKCDSIAKYVKLERFAQIVYHYGMLDVTGGFKTNKTKILIIAGVALLVVLGAVAFYFYQQYASLKNDSAIQNKELAARITSEVGKMLKVPSGEEPQVARITDPEKLKSQSFYADAQKDDFLIVYQKAGYAIIYREKDHMLINVDHVEVAPTDQNATAPTTKK